MRRFLSLRARIALFGGGLVFLAVFAFAQGVIGLVQLGQVNQTNKSLRDRAVPVASWIASAAPEQLSPPQQYLAPADLRAGTDVFAEVLGADGSILFSTALGQGGPPHPPAGLLAAAARHEAYLYSSPYYLYARSWTRPDLGLSGYIVTGQSRQASIDGLNGVRGFLFVSGIFTIAGGLLASWFVAGQALRPLKTVAVAADEIRATRDFGRRLPDRSGGDEIGILTGSFNGMLASLQEAYDRLAASLDSQRQFIADASHELRTPLTSIRTNAAVLQRDDLAPGDRQDAAADITAEAARMSRLVEDLLTLARADAGVRLDRAPVDLGGLAGDVGRQFRRANPERVVEDVIAPVAVVGDHDALQQLLLVLLDNAAKHTHRGGRITVEVCRAEGQAVLAVSDDGDGIPASDLEKIFKRFYQADPSRYRSGAGLGLSIARWIATEHGGAISASNRPSGGARFEVLFPAAP
ncbi:MAG TPA: HAMP domain-containing sensor histidine kinase [Solirubrobacterales bacterium]|nr:HAMP domain-containing sensor histidine kinase [Solirubrobacterales bacterium]